MAYLVGVCKSDKGPSGVVLSLATRLEAARGPAALAPMNESANVVAIKVRHSRHSRGYTITHVCLCLREHHMTCQESTQDRTMLSCTRDGQEGELSPWMNNDNVMG